MVQPFPPAPFIKPEPEDGTSTPGLSVSSTNATPALDTDSKPGTVDSKDFQIIEDVKPDIKEDFDVEVRDLVTALRRKC